LPAATLTLTSAFENKLKDALGCSFVEIEYPGQMF